MSGKFNIISNNVKGLQNESKCRKLFHYFNSCKDVQIVMLQESHSTPGTETIWKAEWGGPIYFSHGTSESRGVCTLVKRNSDIEVLVMIKDTEGRRLHLKVKTQGKTFTMVNIYGPNRDCPEFFAKSSRKYGEVGIRLLYHSR